MHISISKTEIKQYEKLKVIAQMAPISGKIKQFEDKYKLNLDKFETSIKKEDEDFEKWDDLIEWKGYLKALEDLERKLKEIDNAQDVRITE